MSQKSYGTITIVDTNDIARIYVVYAKSATNTDVPSAAASTWAESIANAPGDGDYIWQRTVTEQSGTYEKAYGNPVCVTGPQGGTGATGRGVSSIVTTYCNYGEGTPAASYAGWQSTVPTYDGDKPNYWVKTVITYTTGSPATDTSIYKDNGITDAIYNSAVANSIAQGANENANGALSQANSNINSVIRLWQAKSVHSVPNAPSSEVTTGSTSTYDTWSTIKPTATDTYRYFYYCDQSKTGGGVCSWSDVIEDTSYLSTYEINALNVRTKNFFKGLDNTYDGWFASGRLTSEGLNESNAETYLYNARFAATHISLGYNKTPIIDLDGSSGAIDIYRFPTINSNTGLVTAAGSLGMKLSATNLIFYKPPVGNNSPVAAATLNASGLNITDGSIELDNGTNSSIKISNTDFNRSINNISRSNLRMAIGSNFGVKNDGTLYASNAVISGQITIVGNGSDLSAGLTNYSTTNQMNTAIGIAEANASYSVEIQVTAIDYVNNSATLVAIPYYQGSTTIPSGITLSYQWYKNGVALSDTSTQPSISGATTSTLILGNGTDFGSSTTNAIYTCVIS